MTNNVASSPRRSRFAVAFHDCALLAISACALLVSACAARPVDRPNLGDPEFTVDSVSSVRAQPIEIDLEADPRGPGFDFGTPPPGFRQKSYYLPAGKAQAYSDLLQGFFPGETMKVVVLGKYLDNPTNEKRGLDLLLVRDTESRIAEIEDFFQSLEENVPQVEIEARIVEIALTNDFQIGATTNITEEDMDIDTLFDSSSSQFNTRAFVESLVSGNPAGFQGGILNLGTIHDETIFNIVIEALARRENTEIISTPKLTVLSGMTGVITTGQETPIQTATIANGATTINTDFKKTGILLEVTPVVLGDEVQVTLRPEVSVVTGFTDATTSGGISTPIIATRNAETTVVLQNGSTLVLGGLVSNQEVERESRIPILGSIPFVGTFFSTKQYETARTELRFYVTVRITDGIGQSRVIVPE